MRTTLFAALFAFATAAGAQQQTAPQPASQPQDNQAELDKAAQERVRAERAAGGLGKVTEEDKRGAAIGASPHKERKPGGPARREHGG